MAKEKMLKTNAMRILDSNKINYEILMYESKDGKIDGISVAHKIGIDEKEVFKTLVARSDKNDIIMACIPGDDELHLKKLAQVANFKKVEMIHLKELLPLTGYVRGGCSPLGAKKAYPVFIDETALKWPKIAISAGVRGEQILLAPQDLIKAVNATVADLIK